MFYISIRYHCEAVCNQYDVVFPFDVIAQPPLVFPVSNYHCIPLPVKEMREILFPIYVSGFIARLFVINMPLCASLKVIA